LRPVASPGVQRIAWRALAAATLVAVLIVGRSSVEPGLVVATVGEPPDRTPLVVRGARTPIRHIVFIVKENRSYDSLFGLFYDQFFGKGLGPKKFKKALANAIEKKLAAEREAERQKKIQEELKKSGITPK